MTAKHRPRPITVENSWLNKSIDDRIKILQHVAPTRAHGLEILLNEALKEEWHTIGHRPKLVVRDGGDR